MYRMAWVCMSRTTVQYSTVHTALGAHIKTPSMQSAEPKFLKILKCSLAESASAGFQFNCYDIFNDKTLNFMLLNHFSGLLKFTEKSLFYN